MLAAVAPDAAAVPRFDVAEFAWEGVAAVAAGTGYTGEDGVELAVPAEIAPAVWRAVLAAGIEPAGLGARDTLRLEAGLPLHGHELGAGITPLQAGLGWVVAWDKGDFRGPRRAGGRAANGAWPVGSAASPSRAVSRLARATSVLVDGKPAGEVTSGNFSPMLGPRHRPRVPAACGRARRCGRGRRARAGRSRPRS